MAATKAMSAAQIPTNSSPLPEIDFLQTSSCESLCAQRRNKLKSDEDAIKDACGEIIKSQKESVRVGLCKMKTEWKKMSVKDFNEAFGCDIIEVVRKQLGKMGESEGRKRVGIKGAAASFKTPGVKFAAGKPPLTRTVKKGERMISINGSPIDPFDGGEVFVTAKKRRAVNNTGAQNTPFPISIGVGAGNGETIDLSDPNQRKNLDEEQKAQAMEQIMAMQEQMKNLMANW